MTAVLLISRSREYEARLQRLLGGNLTSVMGAFLNFGSDIVLRHIEDEQRPDVVFLGPYIDLDGASDLVSGLRGRYPGVSIVVVHEDHFAIDDWVNDMGAQAVISPTIDDAALLELVEKLDQGSTLEGEPIATVEQPLEEAPVEQAPEAEADAREAVHESRIIAVVSPKGGLGKTTVATNLAVGLARIAPDSVVLVDGDVQFGDVSTVLALEPAHTLPDMVNGLAPRDTMVLKTFLTPHSSRFYAVCGSDSPADGDRVTGEQFGHLLRQLAGIFRYVIVDTTPGLGEHALTALDQATDAVALCSLGVPNLRALRKEFAVLSSIGVVPSAWHVVLNLADKTSGLKPKDAEAIIGVPVDITIPRSGAVPLSTNRGIPLLQEGSRDPAAKALGELVRRIGARSTARPAQPPRKQVVA
jgi:pilus assembly protein CpaE